MDSQCLVNLMRKSSTRGSSEVETEYSQCEDALSCERRHHQELEQRQHLMHPRNSWSALLSYHMHFG